MPNGNVKTDAGLKQRLASLYAYLSKHLGIKEIPRVIFRNSQENADDKIYGLTGHYNPENKTIVIYTTDRMDNEILRSFAHECVHAFQDQKGTLNSNDPQGEHYAQENPQLRRCEAEAYMLSGLLFRDWSDLNRYGPPTNTPQLLKLA